MDSILIGRNVETNEPVTINLEYLIEQKLQILGNSRSGKSRGARLIAEQAVDKIHIIIISPKREFVTLREHFDFVHVGRSGELSKPDIEINTRYAEQLALDIMKSGINTIIEFSEAPKERIKFGRLFAEGLMQVPQEFWHPTLIIWDEIDIWAPEKGHGEAESLGAIVDLAARGADKGYSLVAITQKLAKFNKDVASELNIKLVGNVSLDTDQLRACEELGIQRKDKKILATLGKPNYYFYAYGPGLSDEVIKIKFNDPITTHVAGWKLNKNAKPIPTPENIAKLLSQFSNLAVEAEKEIKTKDDMKKKIEELESKLRKAESNPGDMELVNALKDDLKNETREYHNLNDAYLELKKVVESYEYYLSYLEKEVIAIVRTTILDQLPIIDEIMNDASSGVKRILQDLQTKISINNKRPEFTIPITPQKEHGSLPIPYEVFTTSFVPSTKDYIATEPITVGDPVKLEVLTQGPSKMLEAIAMFHPRPANEYQVGLIANYTPGAGTFGNYKRELKRKGYVTIDGKMFSLTDLGIAVTKEVQKVNTRNGAFSFWSNYLGIGQSKILKTILDNPGIDLDEVGKQSGYTHGGGTFGNYIRELKRLELITITNKIAKPNNVFFQLVTN